MMFKECRYMEKHILEQDDQCGCSSDMVTHEDRKEQGLGFACGIQLVWYYLPEYDMAALKAEDATFLKSSAYI